MTTTTGGLPRRIWAVAASSVGTAIAVAHHVSRLAEVEAIRRILLIAIHPVA